MTKKSFKIKKRIICESDRFRIIAQDVEFSDGKKETWEFVETKGRGGVRVLALTKDNKLILTKEYRAAANKLVIRVPSGRIEGNETPKETARRELEEETGYRPKKLKFIGKQSSTSGYFKSTVYLFFTNDIEPMALRRDHGESEMRILRIPLNKAYQMVENLEIEDKDTIYAIIKLRNYLKKI